MPRDPTPVELLVLNHNGRALLEECLPSLLDAAAHAPGSCIVRVVDNASTDDSRSWLNRTYPGLAVTTCRNDGLASFNAAVAESTADVVLLLNSDVKLDRHAIAPLVESVRRQPDSLFAAPLCWTFDGRSYEGMRTHVRSRYGLVQGLCRVPGHEERVHEPATTAAAGPVLAIHRARFLSVGGYDPLYLPGRIEDLDLAFRGYLAGWRGYYVPESVAFHQGAASFGPAFGERGNDALALRNTLLFAWKNLAGKRRVAHFAWLAVRVAAAIATGRLDQLRAVVDALRRARMIRAGNTASRVDRLTRQEEYFREFAFPRPTKAEPTTSAGWIARRRSR